MAHRRAAPRRTRTSIAFGVLLAQLALLAAGGIAALLLLSWDAHERAYAEAQARTTALVNTLAQEPTVVAAVAGAHDADEHRNSVALASAVAALQPLALNAAAAASVQYVTIMDTDRVRYTHPDDAQLGREFVGSIAPALAGRTFTEVYPGTLGDSVRAVAPVRNGAGDIVGLVSAGIAVEQVTATVLGRMYLIGGAILAVLLLGTCALFVLFRRLNRVTDGHDAKELARLFAAHAALIHTLDEGVLLLVRSPRPAVLGARRSAESHARNHPGAGSGTVVLANDRTRILLGSPPAPYQLTDAAVPAPVRELLLHHTDGEIVHLGRHELVVTRETAYGLDGEAEVITLRDRTELRRVSGELTAVQTLTHALQAQAHEFDNRLHTIASLIELNRADEALALAVTESAREQRLADDVLSGITNPVLAALLLGKVAQAHERAVALHIEVAGEPDLSVIPAGDLVTIVGNLLDNAITAAAQTAGGDGSGDGGGDSGSGLGVSSVPLGSFDGWVEIYIADEPVTEIRAFNSAAVGTAAHGSPSPDSAAVNLPASSGVGTSPRVSACSNRDLIIQVCDSGPGVAETDTVRVFERGFSTHSGRGTGRGYGLALVRGAVLALGGTVELTQGNSGGAEFTIVIPAAGSNSTVDPGVRSESTWQLAPEKTVAEPEVGR